MSEYTVISSLNKFGRDFQYKCVASLLSDRPFIERIHDIIEFDFFEGDAQKWIVKESLSYFLEYKDLPTLTVFKIKIDAIDDEVLKKSVIDTLKLIYMKVNDNDLKFVKEQFLEFCKNQKLKNAIIESADLLALGKYEKIKSIVDHAMKAGMERNIGHNYVEEVDKRMTTTARSCIKTNWPEVDTIMDGGLGAGELGIITACAGSGKCVGGETIVHVEFNHFGISIMGNSNNKHILWLNPFRTYKIDDKWLYGWKIENIFYELEKMKEEAGIQKQEFYTKTAVYRMSIKSLFKKLMVPDEANAMIPVNFHLKVKTPFGFNTIKTAFRTAKIQTVMTYFDTGERIKSSMEHQYKAANGEWKFVKDLNEGDEVVAVDGTLTKITNKVKGKYEVLYDISVDEVHCYYTNGILSHNSWVLCKLGAEAMKQGKNVMHFTLELNENYVGLRYDACFTGIDFQNIRSNIDVVKNKIAEVPGKLIIKYFPIKTVSSNTLKAHIDRLAVLGTKIDMMIVDYADILRPANSERNSNSYAEAGGIYEELRGVAGELAIPCFSASQSNRCHLVDDQVITEEGPIKIGNVMVGTKILTHLGYKLITCVYPVTKQPVYRIKTKSGKEINISTEHRIPVVGGKFKSLLSGLSVGDKVFIKSN